MKKLIVFLQIITIIFLLNIDTEQAKEQKSFMMTVTYYSRRLIADKWNDGFTAMMTPIREGICAINVDLINGRWIVRSLLKLGDKIHIEGLGNFSVEDTGRFAERDEQQDIWTVDVYLEDYEQAVKGGRELRKVTVLN